MRSSPLPLSPEVHTDLICFSSFTFPALCWYIAVLIFYREVQNEMESVRRKLQQEIEDLNFSKSSLERQNATLDGELTASRTEVAGLKSSVAQLSSSQAKVISELESTKVGMQHESDCHYCLPCWSP